MSKIIAVDFDGTIVTNKYPEIGEVRKGIADKLKQERADGAKLILWTCRTGDSLQAAIDKCSELGIQFDAVNENIQVKIIEFGEDCRKVWADEYWDDKNTDIEKYADDGTDTETEAYIREISAAFNGSRMNDRR